MTPPIPDVLPEPLRENLEKRFSSDDEIARNARYDFRDVTRDMRLDVKQAIAAIDFATDPALPRPENHWEDASADLLQLLWNQPYPELVPRVVQVYGGARNALRLSLLTLVASASTREAAEAVAALVGEHGFPDVTFPRLFSELNGLLDHADVLFPVIFERAGELQVDVGNILLAALAEDRLPASTIDELAPHALRSLESAIEQARPFQRAEGIEWRFEEEYAQARSEAGFFADLMGTIKAKEAIPLLRAALELHDPWIKLFAATSLLRLEGDVKSSMIESIAACHETRAILFSLLDRLGQLGSFPAEQATLDAFAAADMVEWLKFPTELGREPESIEKMATFETEDASGTLVLYVWRFIGHEDEWVAATSGMYEKEGVPGPVQGSATFSRFEPWDDKDAEGHAQAILDTLESWSRSK